MYANFTIRKYRLQDFAAYAQFYQEFSKLYAVTEKDPFEALSRSLSRPGYLASEDLFLAESAGIIIGYINVTAEPGIGRVIFDYLVHPIYRNGSVPGGLIDHALGRARELGADVVHLNTVASEPATAELLSNLGFCAVRRFHELRLELSSATLETTSRLNLEYRCFEPGQEAMLAQIQNHCFADTWGYNPNTDEEIYWHMSIKGNRPDDIILAWNEGRLIGYCWTEPNCRDEPSPGKSKGRIYMLGVRPDHRKRGVGRQLLLAGLSYLAGKGREVIYITVDSQNVAAAALYQSLGFEFHEDTIWYERIMG